MGGLLFHLASAPPHLTSAEPDIGTFPYAAEAPFERTGQRPPAFRMDMRARDGVMLAADVYLPAGDGPWPTLLIRTPYLRASAADAFGADWRAARGYAAVIQDVRGKGDSGGTFAPWENEASDGYDAVEWVAAQPWSSGRIGMLGGSYLGAVQWAAASQHPLSLDAMAVLPSIADPFFGGPYDFGVFSLTPYWAYEIALHGPRASPEANGEALSTLPLDRTSSQLADL